MLVDKVPFIQPLNRGEPHLQHQLRKGDIFRATVVDVKEEGQAVLRVRGELETAITTVPLKPGETALFQVKDIKDHLLVLQKKESVPAGFGEKTLGTLLRELGLPVSPEGQRVIAHLLSKELPLSKKLVGYILKGLNSVPENLKDSFIKIAAWLYGTGIKDPESYQNTLKHLLHSTETLGFLADLLDGASAADGETVKKQLAQLIMAQRDINQSKQDSPKLPDLLYYPLPLVRENQSVPAQLYVVLKNKSPVSWEEPLSLLLSVKGENMGMLWFEIKVRQMGLHITAYTENRDVSDHLTGTWKILKDALDRHNFRIHSFVCREKQVASVFELADELGYEPYYHSVDIKI